VTKDKQAPIIRELSTSINRLNALDFDKGYAAGYDAGVKYLREQLYLELERQATYAMISNEYNFNDTAVRAKTYHHAAEIVKGEPID
jgi:hypothetical protein